MILQASLMIPQPKGTYFRTFIRANTYIILIYYFGRRRRRFQVMKKTLITLSLFLFLSVFLLSGTVYGQISAKLMRYMDVSDSQITFVYGGDIWLMPKPAVPRSRSLIPPEKNPGRSFLPMENSLHIRLFTMVKPMFM